MKRSGRAWLISGARNGVSSFRHPAPRRWRRSNGRLNNGAVSSNPWPQSWRGVLHAKPGWDRDRRTGRGEPPGPPKDSLALLQDAARTGGLWLVGVVSPSLHAGGKFRQPRSVRSGFLVSQPAHRCLKARNSCYMFSTLPAQSSKAPPARLRIASARFETPSCRRAPGAGGAAAGSNRVRRWLSHFPAPTGQAEAVRGFGFSERAE